MPRNILLLIFLGLSQPDPYLMASHQPQHIDLTSDSPTNDGLANTTPPVPNSDPMCTICLGPIDPANGNEPSFTWPACQHVLHLGCVANLRAHNGRPTCPACRQPWTTHADEQLQHSCQHHGILIPDPVRHTHPEQPPRPSPAPPATLLPLCCHRLILLDPAHAEADAAWRELPERHMQWAPNFHQQGQHWTPEWSCLRCNSTVTPDHPLLQHVPEQPNCHQHGPRTLALDLPRGERGWVCTTNTEPPRILDCPPAPAVPTTAQQQPTVRTNSSTPPWASRRPPEQQPGPTNSWLYVPLLHAGAGRLTPAARQAWLQHPNSTQEWSAIEQQLLHAAPVHWQRLHQVLVMVQDLAIQSGNPLPAFERTAPNQLASAAASLPPATQVHLPWALDQLSDASGYIPASAQEALLQVYLGERAATRAALLADRWRPQRIADPSGNNALPGEATNPTSRRGRRGDRQREHFQHFKLFQFHTAAPK
eukprot:s2497_g6.t2